MCRSSFPTTMIPARSPTPSPCPAVTSSAPWNYSKVFDLSKVICIIIFHIFKIYLELMADLIPENIVDECKAFDKEEGSDGNLWKVCLILYRYPFINSILDSQASGCGPLRRGGPLLDGNTPQHLPLKTKGKSKIRACRFI